MEQEPSQEGDKPGEEAREHYQCVAERMSRCSTPCSNRGKTPPAGFGLDWEDGALDLDLEWPGDEDMTESEQEDARRMVAQLSDSGVRLLAIDNDLTLISIHTGGSWSGSASELAAQARPIFKIVIEEAIARGIYVAIVTFSSQPELISEMLTHFLDPSVDTSDIVVHGGLNDVTSGIDGQEVQSAHEVRSRYQGTGKQEHIACSVEELEKRHNTRIEPCDVLMIDDDVKNLEEAKRRGIRCALFDPMQPLGMLELVRSCLHASGTNQTSCCVEGSSQAGDKSTA
eukprot:TRINITY_DN20309_c0_g1_i2.p1 TRINITY_DN20309_c0_g1~~TRINITY_DN20309_c0_g1_i2.p1  ORF type:complete len:285 (-),score=37.59 TRINITY_DN20309_c0_g1_i2:409-1263(-)